jgi:hypothetical protein
VDVSGVEGEVREVCCGRGHSIILTNEGRCAYFLANTQCVFMAKAELWMSCVGYILGALPLTVVWVSRCPPLTRPSPSAGPLRYLFSTHTDLAPLLAEMCVYVGLLPRVLSLIFYLFSSTTSAWGFKVGSSLGDTEPRCVGSVLARSYLTTGL